MRHLRKLRAAALLLAAWLLIGAGASAWAQRHHHRRECPHQYQYHHPTHYVHYAWDGHCHDYPYSTPPMRYRKGVNPFYSVRKPVPGCHN